MKLKETIMIAITALAFMLITGVAKANPVETVTNWLSNEKTKIVEYQTKSWADSKAQLVNTKQSILNLFKGNKDESQN
jgi:hypothetical protein